MRNLKRALSLALASVMLLGMMVVGTSAASYPDVDENDNVEAIEVLNAVNVMIGRQGNFEPDEAVNRHEMAVIMAKLVLGVETADNYVGTHPFTDVVSWADKYVAACYENGLIAGTSATTYGGSQPLTAVQAAAMMLRALGYKDLSVGATDWRAPVTAMANQIRLFNGVASNPNEKLNRNQVAQLALNTLKSPMVNLVDNTITWNSNEGQVVMASGGRQYIALSSREAYARAINRVESAGTSASQIGGWTVELGEHLYNGDLKLNDVTDPFQRPARQWEYDGKEIGTYIKDELLDFEKVGEVTGKDLYDVLGKTAIDEYTMIVALDGVTDPVTVREVRGLDGKTDLGAKHNQDFVFDAADLNRSNKGSVGATGTGVLTQVFVDPNYDNGGSAKDGRIWIAVINTYLARATQDYDSRREELALNAYSVTKNRGDYVALSKDGAAETVRLGVEEYPVVKDADKDDAFLVTFAEGEVQTIVPAEVMEAVTISSFKSKDNLVVDGTKYSFTTTAGFDADALKIYTGDAVTNLKDTTYNVFLDAYGNTIGVQEVDAKKNYVFIAAIDINDSNLVNGTADAKAVFLDGTVDTIRVNVDKSDLEYYGSTAEANDEVKVGGYHRNSILNTWCTYTVNNSNVYTVKQVADVRANGDTYVPGGANNKNTGLAQYHQTGFTAANEKIDKKHITLQGNTTNTGSYARVYGNEKTVYLNAELSNLTNQGGIWGVVKDVDSVTTGAENVNLTVWGDTVAKEAAETTTIKLTGLDYATKGVYTLYDDDGIVIAAVVAGEDDGSAKNLVYVHSGSIESESYNGSSASRAAGDGMWTWTRKVIRNGEEVTLTEVSDGNSELVMMQQYHWYQIKTNADGEVTGVYELPHDDTTKLKEANLARYKDYALTYKNGGATTGNIGEIAYTVQKGADTVLYWNQDYIKSRLEMNGRTLYVATDDQTGFIVNSNVKWVVQQWDNNKKETYIDDGTTAAGLKNMIDEINRRNTKDEVEYNYTYQVSAIIESGVASSVVIYFNENDYNRPDTGNPTGTVTLKWDRTNEQWTLTVPVDDDKVDALTTTQIRNYLLDAGCKDVSKTRDGWNFTIDGTEYIDQIVKVVGKTPATKYTITKGTITGSGDIAFNVTSAKEGDTITVTAAPGTDYKLSSVTTTPDTTVTISGNTATFKMPAADVKVSAEFVAAPPAGKANVTLAIGQYGLKDPTTGATLANEAVVDIGSKFVIDPDAALTVKSGAKEAGKSAGGYQIWEVTADPVVLEAKPGYSWFLNAVWVDKNLVPVMNNTGALAVTGLANPLARAYNVPDWVKGVLAGNTYDIVVTLSDKSTVTWTITKNATNGFQFNPPADLKPGDAAYEESYKILTSGSDEGFVVKPSESDVTPADDRCQAVMANDGKIEIKVYKGFEPTEGQIQAAIAKATGDAKLTSKDVAIAEDGKVTIDGETGFTLIKDRTDMFKVEIDDKAADKTVTIYAVSEEADVAVPETVKGLLPTDAIVGTSKGGTTNVAIAVADGKITLPKLTEDVKYVSALALWNKPADSEELYYANGEATGYTEITPAADTYVQAKAELMVRLTGLTAGAKAGVTINGVDYTGTADDRGNLEIAVNDLVGYAKKDDGTYETTLIIKAYTAKKAYTVKIDGKTITKPNTDDGKWFEDDVITLDTPVTGTLIAGKQCGKSDTTKVDALPGSDYKKIQVTKAVAAGAKDGVLELNTAYQVAKIAFDSAFDLADPKKDDGGITLAEEDLIAKDYELTLTAKTAGVSAKVKDGSKYTLGTPKWTKEGKAVYTIKVTADIADGEFVKDIEVTDTGLANKKLVAIANGDTSVEVASKKTATGSVEVSVKGITEKTSVDPKWSYKGEKSALKDLDIEWKIESGKVVFTFVNNGTDPVTLVKDGSEDTPAAEMLINIGGVEVTVTVAVAIADS